MRGNRVAARRAHKFGPGDEYRHDLPLQVIIIGGGGHRKTTTFAAVETTE